MYRKTKFNGSYNQYNNCNSQGDQLIVLGAIISAIICEEIQNDDELNTIGNLLIAIGSNIVLAAGQRATCNNNIVQNNITDNSSNQNESLVPNTNLPSQSKGNNKKKKMKKVRKRKSKKIE